MEFSAEQIAELVKGEVLGNPEETVTYISKIEDGIPGTLTFLGGEKYQKFLKKTQASIVMISKKLLPENLSGLPVIIVVEDAYVAFNQLLRIYNEMKSRKTGIEPQTQISESAKLGENIYVGSFTYISDNAVVGDNTQIYPQVFIGANVKIGANCKIYAGVKIYDDCIIGNNCVLHSGVVIGADGFGFEPTENGYQKVPQLGNVVLEDDIEVGVNTAIDRATIGSTIIRKGVKLDNLIQVAHNVEIGEHSAMASQSGVAGSSKLGKWNMIGGQAGISGHVKLGDNVAVVAQSGVGQDVEDGKKLFGSPAIDILNFKKSYVYFKNLPELAGRLRDLEKQITKE
ncbi:MAG: UDP-3-O-(3-hydroxymyristoyl)glucosamine N-acyltransferase [Flavobacteriaceae bacterium]|jgi:UDP-3-O-[3-hydroxymyristoyl] glucosamine N-acyltransferase|nr:UDP-3-O-(3-hydroxymyristoyl)glucosamine N-acyltransferase [Flavobacteriaceae bacterium]